MSQIYPNLQEMFRNESKCPICMMEMGQSPKYSCADGHTVCHRCKPYYYACPICQSPLDIVNKSPEVKGYHMPPPMHFMPHPYPPYPPGNAPTAPFIDHEIHFWSPPEPTKDQELKHCGFCYAGCEARFPEHLRKLHESRCQFRPHLEEEKLPTDLSYDEGILLDCQYHDVGCNIRLPEWRKRIHEENCIYKDKLEALEGIQDSLDHLSFHDDNDLVECKFRIYGCMVRIPRRRKNIHEEKCNYLEYENIECCDGDPNELVECKFQRYGCMVRMPRRRKDTHEQKCNYLDCYDPEDYEEHVSAPEENPDQHVSCRWSEYGCQVMPRLCRKITHEEKCNYRMEQCSYASYGCDIMFEPARKYAHEKSCQYAA